MSAGQQPGCYGAVAEALSCVLLAAILVVAITRPRRVPEAAMAVPAAAIVVAAARCR
jgi:arsenical pump membrane protein